MSVILEFLALYLAMSVAQAEWVTELRNPQGGEIPSKSYLKFTTNNEGVRVLVSHVVFQGPENVKGESLKSNISSTEFKFKSDQILLKTRSLKDEVIGPFSFTASTHRSGNQDTWLFDEYCAQSDLSIRTSESKIPFFVGISCSVNKTSASVALSFPEEVSLTRTSIFEIKGKGETWRLFDLGNVGAASGKVAEFELTYEGKSYVFLLGSRKKAGQDKKPDVEKKSRLSLGIGYETLSLKTSDASLSDSKPLLYAESAPLFGSLKLEFSVGGQFAVAIAQSDKDINFYDFQVRAGYCFKMGTYCFSPRAILFSTNFEESSTRGGFSQTIIGGGFALWKNASSGFQQVQLVSSQFLSKTMKTQLQASYIQDFKMGKSTYNFGGQYMIYEYEVSSTPRKAAVASLLFGFSL